MNNSSLISYTRISPNKSSPRNHKIDTITIHCTAGQCTIESLGSIFASPQRQASSNYGIDKNGRIGLFVNECDRSWCSSNSVNDNRAITIEVSSDATHPYKVNDVAFESLIKLCADVCKRNGIPKLLWEADKMLLGYVNKQNMTVHRWFANKACPGDYLFNKHFEIAERVNKLLNVSETTTFPYKIKVTTEALNIRSIPSTTGFIRGQIKDKGIYTIVDEISGWGKLKSGIGWINLDYTTRYQK